MRLINVRRGQFVYYENKLHQVYAVQPFFKQSVHLIRLADMEQLIVTAKEIDLYQPKHLDNFIWNKQQFTLDKDVKATIGDYILVINPRPDSLDHHHLHAIEMVSKIEDAGVISNKMNGIKHNEYWVMVNGLIDGANNIDRQDPNLSSADEDEQIEVELYLPKIGDIYQKNESDPLLQAAVTAIQGRMVFLGDGSKVNMTELADSDRWSLVINALEQ